MEKVLGIIAEYNPFHNGHLYHLTESKKATDSKYVIAVVGNNFTQRGECSLIDKWTKTEMALKNGVDLVIELPSLYSTSCAENFSYGAISILNSLGIVDYLSFGSESGDIEDVKNVLHTMDESDENSEFSNYLKEELSKGLSYPKAGQNALGKISDGKYSNFLTSNNILGLEYISILEKLNSKIVPITISRINNKYNDTEISKSNNLVENISSATSIRNNILETNSILNIKSSVPESSYNILNSFYDKYKKFPYLHDFEKEIMYVLKRMSIKEIANIPDVTEGLEYKIKEACLNSVSLEDLISKIKTKRFTYARICRILICAMLGITKEDFNMSKNITPYARVLGFSNEGKKLLSEITKANKDINLITSVKKFEDNCNNKDLKRLLEIDILSTYIYNQALYSNTSLNHDFNLSNDYNHKIVEI